MASNLKSVGGEAAIPVVSSAIRKLAAARTINDSCCEIPFAPAKAPKSFYTGQSVEGEEVPKPGKAAIVFSVDNGLQEGEGESPA